MQKISLEKSKITVAICTYKRYPLLKMLINTLLMQALDKDFYKLLIIDNNENALERKNFIEEFPLADGIDIIYSSPPGLSRARNLAIEKCTTEFIVFIDDDALPSNLWLESILKSFKSSGASVIAGPIEPKWPIPRPSWVPEKYVACLTVLDHGPNDRFLEDYEFAYGTNMAFKVEDLRVVGGFNSNLGRTGSKTLVSDEEIEVQISLRKKGLKVYYAHQAVVQHLVHENRISKNYFRSRMAWQAVSSLLHDSPFLNAQHSKVEMLSAAKKLHIEEMIEKLFKCDDPNTFSAQIDFLFHFVLVILGLNNQENNFIESSIEEVALKSHGTSSSYMLPEKLYERFNFGEKKYLVAPSTKYVFVDWEFGSHGFLFDAYGDIKNSQLLKISGDPWGKLNSLHGLYKSFGNNVQSTTFLTLDNLIYGQSPEILLEFFKLSKIPIFGILHRLPKTEKEKERLQLASRGISKILTLSDEIAFSLQDIYGVNNVEFFPLPPTSKHQNFDHQIFKRKLGISDEKIIVSVLGEMRKGKGLELIFDCLKYIPLNIRQRLFFILAGRGKDYSKSTIKNNFNKWGCESMIDVSTPHDPLIFEVVNAVDMAKYIQISDLGALLYQGEQRQCMSGVISNYARENVPILATIDSIVGRLTEKFGIGYVLVEEDAKSLALIISNFVLNGDSREKNQHSFDGYNKLHSIVEAEKIFEKIHLRDNT